jgi:hypothetical protein
MEEDEDLRVSFGERMWRREREGEFERKKRKYITRMKAERGSNLNVKLFLLVP